MRSEPNWRVLLIGGSSGTGKTTVAQAIARRFGLSVLMTDDIRLAIQQTTTLEQHPAFHFLTTPAAANRQPPEAIRDGLIAVSEAMANALAIVIAHHVVVPGSGRILIEGDNILPQMATQRRSPTSAISPGSSSRMKYEPFSSMSRTKPYSSPICTSAAVASMI